MILTTTQYQTAIKADVRQTRTMIICYFNPLVAYPIGTVTATSTQDTAHAAEQLIDGRIREIDYLSYGIAFPIALKGLHPGWWSSDLSDVGGVMAIPQIITIDYFQNIRSRNFFIVSPSTNYPVSFTIELSTDAVVWETLETVTANTNYQYTLKKAAYKVFRYFKLTISKMSAALAPVKILQCGAVTTIAFEFYDNDSLKLVEEMRQYNASPLSGVCSSYVEFAVSDENDLVDPDNTNSFFSGLLGSNFTFRPFIGPKTSTDPATAEYEFIPLGVFYSNSAEEQTEGIVSRFVGYDKMSRIKDLAPPVMAAIYDTTMYELFNLLFAGLGLRIGKDYKLDKALTQVIPAGFFPGEVGANFSGETVGEVLNVLSEAGNCYVRCDRFGRIAVRSNFITGTVDATLQDTDYVFAVKKEKDYADHYDQINVRYRDYTGEGDVVELYRADIEIPIGGGPSLDFEFTDPVARVTQIILEGASYSSISAYYPGAVRNIIEFSNATAAETVTLIVKGKKLQFFNTHIEKTNVLESENISKKILSITNWLIQSRKVALSYGDSVLQYESEPFSKYSIIERGNPALEIGDMIRLYDATHTIDKDLQITKKVTYWKGTLASEIYSRIAIADYRWVCVTPPHHILQQITIEKTMTKSWICPGLLITKEMN